METRRIYNKEKEKREAGMVRLIDGEGGTWGRGNGSRTERWLRWVG